MPPSTVVSKRRLVAYALLLGAGVELPLIVGMKHVGFQAHPESLYVILLYLFQLPGLLLMLPVATLIEHFFPPADTDVLTGALALLFVLQSIVNAAVIYIILDSRQRRRSASREGLPP